MLSAKWGLSARLASNGILRVKQLVFSFLLEDLLGSNKTIKSVKHLIFYSGLFVIAGDREKKR